MLKFRLLIFWYSANQPDCWSQVCQHWLQLCRNYDVKVRFFCRGRDDATLPQTPAADQVTRWSSLLQRGRFQQSPSNHDLMERDPNSHNISRCRRWVACLELQLEDKPPWTNYRFLKLLKRCKKENKKEQDFSPFIFFLNESLFSIF